MTGSREAQVVAALIQLADTLVEGYDAYDFAGKLLDRCTELFGSEAGGILLWSEDGLQLYAASDERVELLELLQLQADEGPCVDAFTTGEPLAVQDLSAAADRWPRFAPTAVDLGWVGVHAFPMRLREERVGAINLFDRVGRELDEADRALAGGLADIATIGILHERALQDREAVVEQLRTALRTRVVIEQAKGHLGHALGVDVQTAFELLRTRARATRTRLHDLATAVVDGSLEGDELLG